MTVDGELLDAVAALWRIPRPGPENLLAAPAFVTLATLCAARYGAKSSFALSNALRSLGLPCHLPADRASLSLDPSTAAEAVDAAFRKTAITRRHLCPLDLADDLPPLSFGMARAECFGTAELEGLFDFPRLNRTYPANPMDCRRLAQFHWLVVEERIELEAPPEARAVPLLFTEFDLNRDFGEIEPHRARYPSAVEDALFFLLLGSWEEWAGMREVDWRGFRVPWIYTLDDDLFVRPPPPPSADSLTLEPAFYQDRWGEWIEDERPSRLRLDEDSTPGLAWVGDEAWRTVESARAGPLFETPVAHFLVRAFLSDGIDEVMAHMTAIEAAVGLESDHFHHLRPRPDPHKGVKPMERVAARIAAALGDAGAAESYKALFNIRSTFVHGRGGLQKISTNQRILARNLARRLAVALVEASQGPVRPRTEALSELLDHGMRLVEAG